MASCLISNPVARNLLGFKAKEDSFESDSTTSTSDISTAQNSLETLNNNDANLKTDNNASPFKKTAEKASNSPNAIWKKLVVGLGIFLLFIGRFSIPNNNVDEFKDNVLDYLLPINEWILAHRNSFIPRIMLFCCASNMDVVFFSTLYMWFKHGTTGRLPIALSFFYLIRTAVQQMCYQPLPKGYYWDSPGFPSFVAPYGTSTDFFFSGHSGFLVLMQNEWGAVGGKKMQRYIQASLVYTIFVLLICQAHYSIDIFAGVFFADYVFGKVDTHKEIFDNFFKSCAVKVDKFVKKNFGKKAEKKE